MLGPFFRIMWLRRLIRSTTKPIPENRAAKIKQRLAILYAIFAWNAGGFCLYQMFKGISDSRVYMGLLSEEERRLTPAQEYARSHGIKAKVFRVEGFNVTSYEADGTVLDLKPVNKELETDVDAVAEELEFVD